MVVTGGRFGKMVGFLLLIRAKLLPEGTVVATGGHIVKILGYLLLIFAKLFKKKHSQRFKK